MANLSGGVLVEIILTPMHILRPSILAYCQSCSNCGKRRHISYDFFARLIPKFQYFGKS